LRFSNVFTKNKDTRCMKLKRTKRVHTLGVVINYLSCCKGMEKRAKDGEKGM